ncbi:MAG: hydantoinase B/oxoprolinase family protein [Cohaesibacteraceae bacterium]|nr:hydantoinase B/oxoprolinase family protein [Cohaesibacteraceae bacterium]
MTGSALRAIQTQVMWNRLISVVEEQAQSLLRTAFGSVAREAGDLSAGVYDVDGRMLAQAVTGTPGHVNTMANAVVHFLDRYPAKSMHEGDVYISNDPWLGTGHLFDYVVVTPAFRDGQIIGLFACTCHVIDVGGVGFSATARSVFEEGTLIPHLMLRRGKILNEDVLAIITANSRNPVEVRGDILSLLSSNDTGVTRLVEMMAEFHLDSLHELARHILDTSRTATRKSIEKLPDGSFHYQMPLDGYEEPIVLKTCLTIAKDTISVNFTGTSPASMYGINSPRTYSHAYTVFGLKAVIAPHVPNNAGSLECFGFVTQPGSCVDPERPSPVTARHVIGQMLPDAVFGCLSQALPDTVQAESAGSIWVLALASAHGFVNQAKLKNTSRFNVMNVALGGIGGRQGKDGLSTMAFPSGVGTIPVEITESQCPLYFRSKELLTDSGGGGRWRGGLGQRIEIANTEQAPFTIAAATFDRIKNPAKGRSGGEPGKPGRACLGSGSIIKDKGTHVVPTGDSLIVELPGGGGFGNPALREAAAHQNDITAGYVSDDIKSGSKIIFSSQEKG